MQDMRQVGMVPQAQGCLAGCRVAQARRPGEEVAVRPPRDAEDQAADGDAARVEAVQLAAQMLGQLVAGKPGAVAGAVAVRLSRAADSGPMTTRSRVSSSHRAAPGRTWPRWRGGSVIPGRQHGARFPADARHWDA